MFKGVVSSVNDKTKQKLKKNALEFVDMDNEKKFDAKYKTEMCKSWSDTNFCVYGNKCRFAHGKNELSNKPLNSVKYKLKDCNSFSQNGICMYGARCNFKHDERKLEEMERSFYSLLPAKKNSCSKRLPVFETFSPSTSPLNMSANETWSPEPYVPNFVPHYMNFQKNNLSHYPIFQPLMTRLY